MQKLNSRPLHVVCTPLENGRLFYAPLSIKPDLVMLRVIAAEKNIREFTPSSTFQTRDLNLIVVTPKWRQYLTQELFPENNRPMSTLFVAHTKLAK